MLTRRELIVGAAATLASLALDTTISATPRRAKPIVLINPGHNKEAQEEGEGCKAEGIGYEYDLATKIARNAVERLREDDIDAILTRDENKYMSGITDFLEGNKALIAEKIKKFRLNGLSARELHTQVGMMLYSDAISASAMINIHLDNIESEQYTGHGSTVILSPNASSSSIRLARAVRDNLALPRSGFKYGRRDGMRAQKILMLGSRLPLKTPSCLIECGYIRQQYVVDGEVVNINDERVQKLYAEGIAKGVLRYLKS